MHSDILITNPKKFEVLNSSRNRSSSYSSSVLRYERCPATTSASSSASACDDDEDAGDAGGNADTVCVVRSSKFLFPEAFISNTRT